MADTTARNRLEPLAVFATVLRTPALLRVQLAFLLFNLVEAGSWVAMLVYAYNQGGATASGLVAFAQLAPAVVFAPLAATIGDRMSRVRMLSLAYLVFAIPTLATAAFLLAGLDPLVVYAGAVACGLTLTLVRPAHASVLPAIARRPSELTAANVASGSTENIGVFAGSLGGGLLLAATGPGEVFLAGGIASLVAFLAVVTLRVATSAADRRWAEELRRSAEYHASEDHDHDHGPQQAGLLAEMSGGIRAVRTNPLIRPLVFIVGVSFVLQGSADVLQVVLALDVLGAGDGGVGLLGGSIGVGGLVGAAAAISLVGRRRLVRPMLVAACVAGVGIAASGLVPMMLVGVLGFIATGAGRSLLDVITRTMLQRVTPERYLGRVFGLIEGTALGGLAVGTLVAPVLVALLGPVGALVATGVLLPLSALVLRGALARTDAAGVVHERELAVVRRIGMFVPLRIPELEQLAAHAEHHPAVAGEVIIRQGDPGDCFYMIESGRCEVMANGRVVNHLGPGDGFGEIALLNDVPRTATVTAIEDTELFALDRLPFLEAVTGHAHSRAAAAQLVEERLAAIE